MKPFTSAQRDSAPDARRPPTSRRSPGIRLGLRTREALTGLTLVSPALVVLGIFIYRPLVDTLILSFHEWNMVSPVRQPVGLANYAELVASSTVHTALVNTMRYTIWLAALIIVLPIVVSAALAYVGPAARRFYRVALFAPMVVSLGIAAIVFSWVYNPISGLLGQIWEALGRFPVFWLSNPATVLGAIAVIVAWKAFGYNLLLFLAGFAAIPRELIDAARVDGAEGTALWRLIILPLLGPTVVFVLLATLAMAAEYVFTPVHVLTGGGPLNASTNIVFEVWRQGFRWFRAGYSSALAVVVFMLFLALVVGQMKISDRIVSYEER